MEVLVLLIPLSLLLIGVVVWALFFAVRTGQFEDLEGPAYRVLQDDDQAGRAPESGRPRAIGPALSDRPGRLYHEGRPQAAQEKPMPGVMEQLKTDHVRIARLLDILERELAALDANARVDFDLMHDVMIYMTEYPDQIHHPTEDLVFERMQARGLETARIAELLREHRGLAIKGRHFRDEIESVVDGALVARAELKAQGADYIEFLRAHVAKEDSEVFPAAASRLEELDWQWVEARRETRADPLFERLASQFRALYRHIEEMDR
jgi:cbb3-type cytochrome oxidase maturation protein